MTNKITKIIALITVLALSLTMMSGCSKKGSLTKEEAYNIYYDTIEKFVPELMTEPQECDVDITTHDDYTFLTDHFVRDFNAKVQSQNVDGKLQYYLFRQFPEAKNMSFDCINDDKFYSMTTVDLDKKGILRQGSISMMPAHLFVHLKTPLFEMDAIKSFKAEKKGTDTELTFVVDGTKIEYSYTKRVMQNIYPRFEDKLDDIEIILTINKDGIPKTMSTEISMSIFNDNSGKLHARQIYNVDYVFNKLDNVDFNLKDVASQYASNASIIN